MEGAAKGKFKLTGIGPIFSPVFLVSFKAKIFISKFSHKLNVSEYLRIL